MSMVKIEVDDADIKRLLRNAARRARDLRPVMREIAGIMHDAVEENFAREGRPRWPRLSPFTVAQREAEGTWPGKILQRTGRLAASITQRHDALSAEVGTNVEYAAVHQFGGRTRPRTIRPKRKKALYWPGAPHPVAKVEHPGSRIPARPFLALTERDKDDIRDVLRRFLRNLGG